MKAITFVYVVINMLVVVCVLWGGRVWFVCGGYSLNEIETDTDTTVEAEGVFTRNEMFGSKSGPKLFINKKAFQ